MCTLEKRGNLCILTITGNDEHRLNPKLIDSIRAALKQAQAQATGSSALIITAQGKFFCNGYDVAWANIDAGRPLLVSSKLRTLISDLINFPMPTIAAVTGHVSAAGFFLVLSHDYLLMSNDRGFLYMNELDIGYALPVWAVTLLKSKVGPPKSWREVVLKASKITAAMGVDLGIVDSAHDSAAETVEAAVKLGEELIMRKWDGHVYARNRKSLYAGVLDALVTDEAVGDYGDNNNTNKTLSKL